MTPKTTECKPRTAFFPGSFNPFTAGHYDIALRALELFDRLVIGVGANRDKGCHSDEDERMEPIARLFKDNERVTVVAYGGLTAVYAQELGACAIIRGIRNVKDFEYERDMADVNRRLTGIDTVMLFARPELAAVSSSIVRELDAYGLDVSQYLPPSSDKK